MSAIVIDSKRLLRPVKMMRNLRGTAEGGAFDQIKIEVNDNCNWKSKQPPNSNMPLGDIILGTEWGLASIHKAKVQRSTSDGGREGVAVGVTLFINGKQNCKAQAYRCIIDVNPDDWGKVLLSLPIVDLGKHREGAGITLSIEGAEVNLYYLETNPKYGHVIIEARYAHPKADLKNLFEKQSSMLRFLFSYLTGFGLDGNNTVIALDREDAPIEIDQHLGRRNLRNPYRPIPCTGTDMLQCQIALAGEVAPDLSSEVLGKCLCRLLAEPNLITPLEYLRRFNEVPSEMRGALLSIALESATKHLEQRGLLKAKKPLKDEEWRTVRAALLVTIEDMATKGSWGKGTRNTFVQRVDNMNGPTNADQLTQPFDILNLTLRDDEIEAIKHRNNFIHRGRLLKVEEHEKDPSKWTMVWSAEMTLYTAINKLLLKYLGYSGPLIDWGRKSFGSPGLKFCILEQQPAPIEPLDRGRDGP